MHAGYFRMFIAGLVVFCAIVQFFVPFSAFWFRNDPGVFLFDPLKAEYAFLSVSNETDPYVYQTLFMFIKANSTEQFTALADMFAIPPLLVYVMHFVIIPIIFYGGFAAIYALNFIIVDLMGVIRMLVKIEFTQFSDCDWEDYLAYRVALVKCARILTHVIHFFAYVTNACFTSIFLLVFISMVYWSTENREIMPEFLLLHWALTSNLLYFTIAMVMAMSLGFCYYLTLSLPLRALVPSGLFETQITVFFMFFCTVSVFWMIGYMGSNWPLEIIFSCVYGYCFIAIFHAILKWDRSSYVEDQTERLL